MTSVLVIDDEAAILRALRINLTARDYTVMTASDGASGLAAMARDRPDVVILDLGLPDMDGTDVIRGIRGWSTVPIIVLSAHEQELQKVQALDAGADDYVTKPFGMNELLARLRAATRRAAPGLDEPVVVTAEFTIDLGTKRVTRKDGRDVRLTPTEWAVARGSSQARRSARERTAVAAGCVGADVWDRNQLPARLHGPTAAQLEPDPARPRYLITEPGMGYRLVTS